MSGRDPAPPVPDPHDLARFVEAQQRVYATALDEIRRGRKESHWMWFVFPQLAGLGASPVSRRYAIRSLDEARAYLAHPLLGPRLAECVEALLRLEGVTAAEIFGFPDDRKLRLSATLFALVSPPGSPFERILEKYCGGERDGRTLELLGRR